MCAYTSKVSASNRFSSSFSAFRRLLFLRRRGWCSAYNNLSTERGDQELRKTTITDHTVSQFAESVLYRNRDVQFYQNAVQFYQNDAQFYQNLTSERLRDAAKS